jgi:hypothetical protein
LNFLVGGNPSHGRGRRFNPYSAHHFGNETAMKQTYSGR